jgi:hypothetical protein
MFEKCLVIIPDLHDFVYDRWHSYCQQAVIDKLNLCATDLSYWNKNHCQHLRREIDNCRKKLDRIQANVNSNDFNYFTALRNRMFCLFVQDNQLILIGVSQIINKPLSREDHFGQCHGSY